MIKETIYPNDVVLMNVEELEPHPLIKQQVDEELVQFMMDKYTTELHSDEAKELIGTILAYLDSLCSARFDVPTKTNLYYMRNSIYCVSDFASSLITLFDDDEDTTIAKIMYAPKDTVKIKLSQMRFSPDEFANKTDIFGDMPNIDKKLGIWITIPGKCENLTGLLANVNPKRFDAKDRKHILDTLKMIVKKTADLEDEIEEALYVDEV